MTWADDTTRILTGFWRQNASFLYLSAKASRSQKSARTSTKSWTLCWFGRETCSADWCRKCSVLYYFHRCAVFRLAFTVRADL